MTAPLLFTSSLALPALFQPAPACGAPLGHFAWGGAHRVLPRRFRSGILAAIAIYVLIAAAVLDRADSIEVLPDAVSTVGPGSSSPISCSPGAQCRLAEQARTVRDDAADRRLGGAVPDHRVVSPKAAPAPSTPGRGPSFSPSSQRFPGPTGPGESGRQHQGAKARRGRGTVAALRPRPRLLQLRLLRAAPAPDSLSVPQEMASRSVTAGLGTVSPVFALKTGDFTSLLGAASRGCGPRPRPVLTHRRTQS